ncbi:MAG: hypothetical protein KME35_10625 [Aphanocapsa sp. GSE-SYN-MK-11-07L]|jgi:hypothetical protein|nr:hypothetical protein [Aphanocapsa sp. GSE-SYN-MK-11-07L]
MTQVNYAAMSDQELKQYCLTHRDDEAVFHAYMDRRNARPKKTLIAAGELDHLPFVEQQPIISERMTAHFNVPIPKKNPELG